MNLNMIDLSLGRISKYPYGSLPPTIHVAGTNGKGSTLAFMKSILEKAGYKIHRYTSPPIWSVSECIELAGTPVASKIIDQALESFQGTDLTHFEALTLVAFRLFSETSADFLLLETGLGGRLDATNIIKEPVVTAITSIGYDHQEFLGSTLQEIAAEKAGIIKPYLPCCVSACVPEEALAIIQEIADLKHAPLIKAPLYDGELSLQGYHQKYNAGLAVTCLKQILNLTEDVIQEGLLNTYWPGRLEKIHYKGRELWIDGAHNEEGAQALITSLPYPGPWHAIVGIKSTKDYKAILDTLRQKIDSFAFISLPEAHDPCLLAHYCPGIVEKDFHTALHNAPHNASLIITGSFLLLGLIEKEHIHI